MTTKKWREEFDKEFCIGVKGHTFGLGDWITDTTIKDFISTLLSKERNKVLQEALKLVDEDINRNAERGFPTSAVARQWILTQLKSNE